MAETGLSRNQIFVELAKSEHGDLKQYVPVGYAAAREHPDFLAHLLVWNKDKGQVRDTKAALPVIALMNQNLDEEFVENALACLTLLNPRDMLKAYRFVLETRPMNRMTMIKRTLVARFHLQEKNWPKWERTMLQHRETLRELFALLSYPPVDKRTDACLFRRKGQEKLAYPPGGLFELVAGLKNMSPKEAAGMILTYKLPFLPVTGALGDKAKDPDVVLAMIKSMTATELVTSMKKLERLGVKTNPALRGALEEALGKSASSTANVLKATTAAENIGDEDLAADLNKLQAKQTKKFSNVDGNWAVLGDRSPSMSRAVQIAKEVAAVLTSMVKGKVHLVFFDSLPQVIDVTGCDLSMIKKATRHIEAGGSGTSIGCGLKSLQERKYVVDGIAIVSDGGHNTAPSFPDVYKSYSKLVDKEVPVYLFLTEGDDPRKLTDPMEAAGIDMHIFDLRRVKLDAYSIPNLVQTMRTNRYSLVDEIMETKLLKLSDEYKGKRCERTARASGRATQ
jgi:hypothetical protein